MDFSNANHQERPVALNDIGFEQNDDIINMGKYGEATGGDIDQIEQHLSESMAQLESFENTVSRQQPGHLKNISGMSQNQLNKVESEEDLKTESDEMDEDY